MQMDGTHNIYRYYIDKAQISFINTCSEFYKPTYKMDNIWVRNLDIRVDLVLGLDFILHNKGGTLITKDEILFMKNTTYTSVLTKKIDTKVRHKEKCCNNCKNNIQCTKIECNTLHESILEINEEDEIVNKNYVLIEMETELYNFKIGIQQIGQIKNQQDLDNIVKILDQIEIIGEKPLKHWENKQIVYKLDIIIPEYIIETASIEATNQDKEDFKMQIKELVELGVIRRSTSKHRSAAFMVRNLNEIVRGKARMVINYKRLNDNTRTDGYKLPDKIELINRIQGKTVFSKFDCKSGYWQIKMHLDSIEWTTFTCPEGHFEWLVMPFGLKTAPPIFQRKMDQIFGGYKNFVLIYVDDILVFSKNIKEHLGHLQTVLLIF